MSKRKVLKLYIHGKFFIQTFMDKELTLFAASLSFYTIFSLVPLLLILTTVVMSLDVFTDIYVKIKEFLFENLLPVNSEIVMGHLNGFLQNSSEMSGVSFATLFVSSLLFFKNYDFIANRAFHTKPRGFFASVKTYFVMLLVTPIALGSAFYVTSYIATLMASSSMTSWLNILPLVPYLIIWILFFILFKLSANIKVHFKAALLSSLIISIIFSFAKNSFIYYVIFNQSYATIYGSFAIALFLFLWIYFSWIIFIYGLKLCYLFNRIYRSSHS